MQDAQLRAAFVAIGLERSDDLRRVRSALWRAPRDRDGRPVVDESVAALMEAVGVGHVLTVAAPIVAHPSDPTTDHPVPDKEGMTR